MSGMGWIVYSILTLHHNNREVREEIVKDIATLIRLSNYLEQKSSQPPNEDKITKLNAMNRASISIRCDIVAVVRQKM